MPPRPRPIPRKQSVSKVPPPTKLEQDAKAMPPPPAPPAPGILVNEVAALSTTLKNAVVKTGQLYAFYADTRRLYVYCLKPTLI
ncbi:hypothetical protein C8R47DRAFT_547456 [Mycena vitilis]|nr:hypothetical protein C8R47DRAFT_547456 [Mycena vitilis]